MNHVVRSRPVRGPVRLTRAGRWAIYGVGLAVWATGVLYLLFDRFVTGPGEFGPEPHALQPWWLRLHGAASFAALWLAGLLWGVHVLNGWRTRMRRWSGALLFGTVLFLIASGYLLYYAGGEALRTATSSLHWIVGLAVPAVFVWHRFLAQKTRE